MTKNRTLFTFIGIIISILASNPVFAETAKQQGNVVVHIAHRNYEHPMRLLHPYLDVWHMKGPLAEKVALSTLGKRIEHIDLCKNTDQANVVLLLEPNMFYNPQLRVFHAEIIAKAFVNNAESKNVEKPFITVQKQAQQIGDLSINPNFYMEKAYTKAMDKIIQTLESDSAFTTAIANEQKGHAKTLCTTLDDLSVRKIYY